MHKIGLWPIYRKRNLSKRNHQHKIYPYLLEGLAINRPGMVWATDITYIRMAKGFVYMVAIIDWHSRYVLSWRLSTTIDTDFCVEALKDALSNHPSPEIFNTDQGSQFTADDFTSVLKKNGIKISMDGKGRWRDNVFIERLWKSLKYEEVYLKAYETVRDARAEIGKWIRFYNEERLHQSLDYCTPSEIYRDTDRVTIQQFVDDANQHPNAITAGFRYADSL